MYWDVLYINVLYCTLHVYMYIVSSAETKHILNSELLSALGRGQLS